MKKLSKNKNKNPIKLKFKDNNSKMKKHKIKFTTVKPPKEKVMIVAQELKFARLLAGNEKKSRDRVLKALKKWLNNCFVKRYEFKEDDFVRIWKGLFYAVWMSDKPLVQEELCDNISSMMDQFPAEHHHDAMMMTAAGLKVLATEWYGLDQHRIDKFLMLVRRYLRGSLRCVHRAEWTLEACKEFAEVLGGEDGLFAPKTPTYARNAISLLLHIADCFLEEVAKVSQGEIPEPSLVELLRPFAVYMKLGVESRVAVACRRVLSQLARQSKPALEGEEKRKAWRGMGCPEGGPDALEPASDDDEEFDDDDDDGDGPKALDPRAGRVDVMLPLLPPAAALMAHMLQDLLKTAAGQARARIKAAAERFKKIAEDKYPFPDRDVIDVKPEELRWDGAAAARELKRFELDAISDPNKNALNSLSRRKRKKLLSRARAGDNITSELAALAVATTNNGEWNVEESPASDNTKKKKKRKSEEPQDTDLTDTPKKLRLVVKTEKSPKTPKLDKKVKQKNKENNNTNDNIQKAVKSLKETPKISKKIEKSSPKTPEKSSPKTPEKASPKTPEKSSSKKSEKVKSGEQVKLAFKISPKPESPKEKIYSKPDKVKLVVKTSSLKSPKGQSPKGQSQSPKGQGQSPIGKNKGQSPSPKGQIEEKKDLITPKKVKFVLKNNSMQQPIDYYKSIRESPNIPFDGTKKPTKTNLKPNSTPSPINPFFKKKLRLKIKV